MVASYPFSTHPASIAQFWYPQSYHNFHSWPNAFLIMKSLSSGSTHLFTSIIPFSKSIPSLDAIIPSNRAHLYNSNDIHFDSIPILEGEIRHLPVICLHIFTDTYHTSFERSF